MSCRICKSDTFQNGLLHKCTDNECSSVYWDKKKLKRILNSNPDIGSAKKHEMLSSILSEAKVPSFVSGESYVYLVRLRGKWPQGTKGRIYVGMTGLHPYERLLNHQRGYKASSIVKKLGTALVGFEGPMSHDEAVKREPELAEELKAQGYDVHGGK